VSVSRSESDSPAASVSKVFFRARARAARPIRSHRCYWKQDAARPQMGEHRLDDGLAAIRGPCRVHADPETGAPVGETEALETQ
jgi:hypothetical protein